MKTLRCMLRIALALTLLLAGTAVWAGTDDAPLTVIKNVNLVPMTDEKVIPNQTVLVRGDRILEIGPAGEISAPEKAKVIDGAGKWLMPGLADMHMHVRKNWMSETWPISPLKLYLANGVTTIRCFGPGGGNYVLRWRDLIRKGRLDGPILHTCGPVLFGPVAEPAKTILEQQAAGFDFIKVYSYVTRDEFQEIMSAAGRAGIYVAGHIPFSVGLDGVIAGGYDEIAHVEELDFEFLDMDRTKKLDRRNWLGYVFGLVIETFQDSVDLGLDEMKAKHGKAIAAVAEKVRAAGLPVCTTLVVDDVIVQKLFHRQAFLSRPESRYLPGRYLEALRDGKEKHQRQFKGHEKIASMKYNLDRLLLMALKEAGVTLLLSTDAATGGMGIVPGFSLHEEMRILTECGFTPYEAMAAGTVNASKTVMAMTGKDDFGTIEKGKRADFILLGKNPLENVEHIRTPLGVMAAGKWYDRTDLKAMIQLAGK